MRILVVCLGNICRSPTAEAVLRKLGPEDLEVDSAGTGAWHVGNPPDPRMQDAAAKRGYDLAPLRARQVRRGEVQAPEAANAAAARRAARPERPHWSRAASAGDQ